MTVLTLAQASTIVDKALDKGRELKLHPLTVVVLDAGGHLVAMKREDKSGILRTEIATGKARLLTPPRHYVWHARWSPDARRLAFLVSPTGKPDDENATDIGDVLCDLRAYNDIKRSIRLG